MTRGRGPRAQQPWNINIHYDALLDSKVPPGARRVLDVGCGDGFLAARLARRIPDVTALDVDAPVLQRAQARFAKVPIRWVQGDIMTADLPRVPGVDAFDAVVSNAALHHLEDTRAALRRLAELVSPGGTLAVVTFVKPSFRNGLWHLTTGLACMIVNRVRGKWEHTAPIKWPPSETLRQLRIHVRSLLPGARVRRLCYGRVLITWCAPDKPLNGLECSPSL
ncbi:class I SAM-dependent methyltransferase [Mycobacterium haemophilum]|uniref:SAM-dependent methyltransferase n=1 Tax=Mycobacterium haemophilum TaxID=29311 RepID=A0A0I9VGQ4_9MYCO|nr:class I SAM-dependent methyltransferase [Mycobacterium haemophilum]AKN15607.1 SAM-dependent methyltransferase [Mycobacterium haemophilum DSM 44634]KLO32247.1 SAM-dependent methyltransferase [Mycobacterium haemophilum]KLO36654.1 SAM-dependent methyltransferase [Mycobacterium haemophilum]KLO42582.1 SAM-dependent methyltransferase [Mycobacterium haemophilum]KLO55458.1 SAM-dependent methyltransferase [Mycobacterium haemophilum]